MLLYYYRTDKRQKFHKPFSQTFEGLELKTTTGSLQYDDSGSNNGEFESTDDLSEVPVRNDITVSDFPDYVQEMTEEYEPNGSKLAKEYFVSICECYYHDLCINYLTHRNFSIQVLKHTVWHPFLIMLI